MVFTVYCLYCNVSGLVVLLLNKFDLIWFDLNPEKETKQNTAKPNYPGLVASYDTRLGNEMGLFYTKLPSQNGTSQQNRNDSLFVYTGIR